MIPDFEYDEELNSNIFRKKKVANTAVDELESQVNDESAEVDELL